MYLFLCIYDAKKIILFAAGEGNQSLYLENYLRDYQRLKEWRLWPNPISIHLPKWTTTVRGGTEASFDSRNHDFITAIVNRQFYS